MRRVVFGLLLIAAGCGARASTGPAWPKSASTELEPVDDDHKDGGETLEPHQPASVASVEASSHADEPSPADTKPADAAGDKPASTDTPTDAPPTPPATTDPPVIDEITIEVHGDGP